MRRVIPLLALLLLSGFTVARSGDQAGMVCKLTGKNIQSCCCTQKSGKLYCTLANKAIDNCCCKSASK